MDARVEADILRGIESARDGGPAPIDGLEEDDATGASIRAASYLDPARHEAEAERVFARSWLPAARAAELAEPGELVRFDTGRDSVVVVRGEDGELRGLRDVCRHRGARIVRTERGRLGALVCPYHGFTYGLDGRLVSCPEPASFGRRVAAGETRLGEVATAELGGWLWVHTGPDPVPLEQYLGVALLDELTEWPLAEVEVKDRVVRDCEFDWKVGVEAFLEPLHVPSIHARTANPVVDIRRTVLRGLGEHSRMALPFRLPRAYETDGPLGSHAAANDVHVFDGLNRAQRVTHLVYLVFPSTILLLMPNHFTFFSVLPRGAGRCRFLYELYGAPAASSRAAAFWESVRPGYAKLFDEDLENLPWVQRGVADGGFQRVELSSYEQRIGHFRRALEARLAAGGGLGR
jgi:phenylpropionate dioxygenase-like ring-hydroxylating dioxygenase large terminal subunit